MYGGYWLACLSEYKRWVTSCRPSSLRLEGPRSAISQIGSCSFMQPTFQNSRTFPSFPILALPFRPNPWFLAVAPAGVSSPRDDWWLNPSRSLLWSLQSRRLEMFCYPERTPYAWSGWEAPVRPLRRVVSPTRLPSWCLPAWVYAVIPKGRAPPQSGSSLAGSQCTRWTPFAGKAPARIA